MRNKIKEGMVKEGMEMGDLRLLVKPVVSIDAFRSKMGDDKDICVLGFTVFGKFPAMDLSNFVEKMYDWVLDADVSSGELSDGNFMVFVELERDKSVCDNILALITDALNLTTQKLSDWTFTYFKGTQEYPLTAEELVRHVLTTPEKYEAKVNTSVEESRQLNSLRALAGVKVAAKPIKDAALLNMQIAAGIK